MGDTIIINGKKYVDIEAFFDRIVKAKTDYLYPDVITTSDDEAMETWRLFFYPFRIQNKPYYGD